MNTHNGKELSNEVLAVLAVTALTSREVTAEQAEAQVEAARSAHQKDAAFRSWALEVTRQLRFEMMGRGELDLRTSIFTAPEPESLELDWEMISFLKGIQ